MKIRSSTKIAVGFVVLVVGGYFGRQYITDQMIMNEKFSPIEPGRVNLVGIDAGAGYRIITANFMAQLVEASGDFDSKDSDSGGATEGAIKKRVPIKELLQTLQGNEKALGQFIMVLNDMAEDDTWPTARIVWKAEDIEKALKGDKALAKKLEANLNMKLDGLPLSLLDFDAMENGIIVETPVAMQIPIGGKVKEVIGRVQEPYRPRIMKAIEARLKDKGNVTREMQAGYYKEEAEKILKQPKNREIVADSLKGMISKETAAKRIQNPTRVLGSASVIVSDNFITGASFREYKGPDNKPLYDLVITLNDEGRKRLWQYSKKRVGTQILITADGIPVAAPRIRHELEQGELTITQMQDRTLVEEAVDSINGNAKKETAQRATATSRPTG